MRLGTDLGLSHGIGDGGNWLPVSATAGPGAPGSRSMVRWQAALDRTVRSPYPRVADKPDFPEIEREVLAYWADDGTFEASVKARSGAKEFVFYDGPPFANGLPHYGHLLTGYVKGRHTSLQDDARLAGGKAVRLGLPRPAGGDGGGQRARAARPGSTSSATASAASTSTAEPRSCVIRANGSATSPARPAGSISPTITRQWTSPTWRA